MGCCTPTTTASAESDPAAADATRDMVRGAYSGAIAAALADSATASSCCSSKTAVLPNVHPITRDLYSASEASEVPADALLASFGCGNPTALAQLLPGQIVLDLGSGGGIDVLLSAKRVGATGKAYGLDMTDEMLALARRNALAAGINNVEFVKGHIEAVPLADTSVDVIISNCVINLSPNKDAVLAEAFRVLRPGGRFAVSDIVLSRALPEAARANLALWAGCISGALLKDDYAAKLSAAGFTDVKLEVTRTYSSEDAREIVSKSEPADADAQLAAIDGAAMSCFIRATKPLDK